MNSFYQLNHYIKRRLFKIISLIFHLCLFNTNGNARNFLDSPISENNIKNKPCSQWDDIKDDNPYDNRDTIYNSNEFYGQPFCFQYPNTYSTEDNKGYRRTTSISLNIGNMLCKFAGRLYVHFLTSASAYASGHVLGQLV